MESRLNLLIKEENIPSINVISIHTILNFLKNLVDMTDKYEAIYPNAFRFCVNLRTDLNESFSLRLVCL